MRYTKSSEERHHIARHGRVMRDWGGHAQCQEACESAYESRNYCLIRWGKYNLRFNRLGPHNEKQINLTSK